MALGGVVDGVERRPEGSTVPFEVFKAVGPMGSPPESTIVLPLPFRGATVGRAGAAVAVVGGVLIFLEGALGWSYGFAELSEFAVVAGGAIVGLAVAAELRSRFRQLFGALILLIALASLFGISGYLLGTLLGTLGGSLLVLTPGFSASSFRGRPTLSSADLGPPCPTCGRHVPLWTSTCPYRKAAS
ncbi:MAG: hypothetical protein L3K23_02275 [Thermoplasmata archaeon]|nr:hypothetical protein [Thermoplasmata archaeon]